MAIVAAILIAAIAANVTANLRFPALLDLIPVIGLAVWVVILATAPLRQPDWSVMPETFKGTIFLLALVTCASLMPVEELPLASWQTALGLGFLSAVFDNIPLTALALKQGGYDWGYLAYAVGFGGSMIWFGSSAGVALSNMYPEAKSVGLWLRHGWHVAIAYVIGFFVMLAILGWKPDPDHRKRVELPNDAVVAMVDAANARRRSLYDAAQGIPVALQCSFRFALSRQGTPRRPCPVTSIVWKISTPEARSTTLSKVTDETSTAATPPASNSRTEFRCRWLAASLSSVSVVEPEPERDGVA